MKNWVTSFWGYVAWAVGIGNVLLKWHNGQPLTQDDLAIFIVAGGAGAGLIKAADAKTVNNKVKFG